MTNDEIVIRQLIRRFMDGKTTAEEEARIGDWLRQHPDAPADLDDYRVMFQWFDQGMPADTFGYGHDAEPAVAATEAPTRRDPRLRMLWGAVAAAAAVVLLLVVTRMGNLPTGPVTPSGGMEPVASVPPRDTLGKPQPAPDTISTQTVPQQKLPRQRYYRRGHYAPKPPMPLLAINDSMLQEGNRKADEMLRMLEAEQEAMFRQLYIASANNEQTITATIDGDGTSDEDGQEEDAEIY